MSAPGEGETETKEIIANVLRGFLLLENAALTGSEEVFVFGVAGKKLYVQPHCKRVERDLEQWLTSEEP